MQNQATSHSNAPQSLKRQVGLRTVVSTGAGLALASISYVSLIEMSDHVGGHSGWIALLVSAVICYLSSRCFAELGGMYPTAAGIKLYIEKAFNERTALILASLYILTTLSVVGAETYVLGHVLSYGFPEVPVLFWVLSFLFAVAYINIRGVKLTGAFQDVVAYFKFAALITVSWLAISKFGFHLEHTMEPFANGKTGFDFFQAIGIGVFLFLGFEWVTPLAEEVKEYKVIPLGMALSILLLFVAYGSMVTAMTSVGDQAEMSAAVARGEPIPHVLFAVKAFGKPGVMLMMLMSFVASITCFNAGLLTASRFLYAMARDNAAPKKLASIHDKYMTPHVAVWSLFAICAALSVFVYYSKIIKPFIYMGAFASCMIYVTMALSLIRLRFKAPNQERPYRVGSLIIPALVAVFFTALGIGLLAENMQALGAIAVLGVCVLIYVLKMVPQYKKVAEAEAAARPKRRRPVASSAANSSENASLSSNDQVTSSDENKTKAGSHRVA